MSDLPSGSAVYPAYLQEVWKQNLDVNTARLKKKKNMYIKISPHLFGLTLLVICCKRAYCDSCVVIS